ncbi:MAG TPA: DNA translocase FtsK 4TM domain-containing protein [bacterium]|nr:DNA translocase FtsK 4TM domain-containing protein [bacterium]
MARTKKSATNRSVGEARAVTVYQLFHQRAFRDAVSVVVVLIAALSIVSIWGGDSASNPVGTVGRWIYGAFALLFGVIPSYPLLVALLVLAFATLIRRRPRRLWLKVAASFVFAVSLGAIFALIKWPVTIEGAFFGWQLAKLLVDSFSAFWAMIITAGLLVVSAMLVVGVGLSRVLGLLLQLFGAETAREPEVSSESASAAPSQQTTKKPRRRGPKRAALPVRESGGGSYQFPGMDLLDPTGIIDNPERRNGLIRKGEQIVEKLADHRIDGKIAGILTGPIITRFEFRPARGVKLSRIVSLADDLALAMKARFVPRIAPIPGRSVVGVEVANDNRRIITFREVLSSDQFAKNPVKLKLAIGTDIAGQPQVISLNEITHILIAGATGTGKSVCINSMLCSLLYCTTPEELELILIDPKVLELSPYNKIPHLREPVISDVQDAELAFRWAVSEMDKRYQLLAERKVRHVDEFNERVLRERKVRARELAGVKPEDMPPELKTMPYLVIVVDELADLMLSARQAIEVPIVKLAAKARAAGIHLVLATQRPSVDVVTGLIKTNFPSRLAFRVAQKVDSRIILDQNGAETLLGKGDMLFLTPGAPGLIRLHGAFISEREIERIVRYLKSQPAPVRESSIFDEVQLEEPIDFEGTDDPHYRTAVEIVIRSKYASISLLQRKLKIGHSRAARYIDMMEQQGIVGPFRGSKPREVLKDEVNF